MKTIRDLLLVLLLCGNVFAGTISGEIIYTGSMPGIIYVIFMQEGDTAFDPLTLPSTILFSPGTYSIDHESLVDGVEFYGLSFKGSGMPPVPASGNPVGITPEPVVLSGGVATDVDITLEEEGAIGGKISYDGDISKICINIWDAFPELLSIGEAELESTICVGDTLYLVEHVPAGAKKIEAFADINDNGVYNSGEPCGSYDGPLGHITFVGGGSDTDTNINITIIPANVAESFLPKSTTVEVSPNPFNSAVRLRVLGPGARGLGIEIYDIQGKIIASFSPETRDFIWQPDESVTSGVYLVRVTTEKTAITKRAIYLK